MSNMKADEMYILKAVSTQLSDDKLFILTLQYHVEKGDRSKSRYRWLGAVYTTEQLEKMIATLRSDAHALEPWKWPDDPSWDGKIYYTDNTNARYARWLRTKQSKAVDFETFTKICNGWNHKTDAYNAGAKYETEGYTTSSGETISVLDKDALLRHVNENIWKEVVNVTKNPPKQQQEMEAAVPQAEAPAEDQQPAA